MKIGIVFPQTEMPLQPRAIIDYAQGIEEMGFDYLLAYDHVLGADKRHFAGKSQPYSDADPFHEVFVLFGFLAGITQRIELTTGILILPQRQTALVAKQAAQVDFLSGGRLRLGVGVGWNHVEYQALGMDFKRRGKRAEAQIPMLKQLWTKRLTTIAGMDEEQIEDAGIHPLPAQRPIPIWFGGGADAVLRRMAKWGDGWMPPGTDAGKLQPKLATLREYLRQNERDPKQFGIDARVSMRQSPAAWRQQAALWREAGATHICLHTMNAGIQGVDGHLAAAQQFIETVR